jgi:hypothetical protein
VKIPVKTGSVKHTREHPHPDVDVMAFDVTELLVQYPQIQIQIVTYDMFADSQTRERLDIKIADEILMIGYPLGLRHQATNFPLVTTGIITTHIGELIEEPQQQPDGSYRKRILRGFWINGTSIPGSSGSPVVLRPLTLRYVKGRIQMQTSSIVLLGVIAETKYFPAKMKNDYIPSLSGLGLAFDTETIKETIELFY